MANRPQVSVAPMVEQVAQGVWRLNLRKVNAYVLATDQGTVLVDTGNPGDGGLILDMIRELGLASPGLALLTHADVDHAGGAREIRRLSGAAIGASRHERQVLAGGGHPSLMRRLGRMATGRVACAVTLDDGEVAGGLRIIATPGHTPGHVSFLRMADGILFTGDALAVLGDQVRIPRAPYTEDIDRACASLAKLQSLGPRLLLPGHGKPLGEPGPALRAALRRCEGAGGET